MTYNSINLMCPTYGRHDTKLPVYISSALDTASDMTALRFTFCVNDADTQTQNFLTAMPWPEGVQWEMITESSMQPNLAEYFNLMYDNSKFKEDENCLVSMLGDDMIFKTDGWDKRILSEVNQCNGVGVFWCNDDYVAKDRCCVNMFVTRQFVGATRKPFMCNSFAADMIDVIWYDVAVLSHTAHYLRDVIIYHDHNSRVQSVYFDNTFRRLVPLQRQASTQANHKIASNYASIVAHNLILADMGSWEAEKAK